MNLTDLLFAVVPDISGKGLKVYNSTFTTYDTRSDITVLKDTTINQHYIVPNLRVSVPVGFQRKQSILDQGGTISIGFRTPLTATEIIFLFDMEQVGFCAYLFFKEGKFAVRLATTDLISPQPSFAFQPDTDYHMTVQYQPGMFCVYINGSYVMSSTSNNAITTTYGQTNLRLFSNERYSNAQSYCSRFYYLYAFSNTQATPTLPPVSYLNTFGRLTALDDAALVDITTVTTKNISVDITPTYQYQYKYKLEGQVTFNNAIKERHPSTTIVQLIDIVGQKVTHSIAAYKNVSFTFHTDLMPKHYQVIAVDLTGEFNTQILQI